MPQPAVGGGRCFRAMNRRGLCKTQSPASTAMPPRNVWTTSFRPTRRNMHIDQSKMKLLGFGPSERTTAPATRSGLVSVFYGKQELDLAPVKCLNCASVRVKPDASGGVVRADAQEIGVVCQVERLDTGIEPGPVVHERDSFRNPEV